MLLLPEQTIHEHLALFALNGTKVGKEIKQSFDSSSTEPKTNLDAKPWPKPEDALNIKKCYYNYDVIWKVNSHRFYTIEGKNELPF